MYRNRNFWILMLGEAIAGLGLWFGMIGNLEFLQQQVPSDFLKALILMGGPFTGLLLGPWAGRLIDSLPKKKILLVAGFLRIFGTAFMFLALAFDSVWWMVGYTVVIGGVAAFYFPALQALLPKIAGDQDLLQINSFYMNVSTMTRILGTAVAGVLLIWLSLWSLYLFTLFAYIVIWFTTLLLQVDEKRPDPSEAASTSATVAQASTGSADTKHPGTNFRDVFPMIKATPAVLMGVLLTFVPSFFLGGFTLITIAVSDLQHDQAIKGLLYTVEGVSFLAGAFLVKRLVAGRSQLSLMLFSAFLMAAAHMSLTFAAYKWASLASFAGFGFGAGMFFPLSSTLFQNLVPAEYHGRFFSFKGMLDRVLFQLIMLSAGLLLDSIGLTNMSLIYGGTSLLLCIAFALRQQVQQDTTNKRTTHL